MDHWHKRVFVIIAGAAMFAGSDQAVAQTADQQSCYKGSGDVAIAACSRAIRQNPIDKFNYYGRGLAWLKKGDYDKAIADLNEAIRLDPKYALAYNNRGFAWSNKGENDRAIADFNEAIRLDPQHANSYNNRGALNDALLSRVIQIDCSFAIRENQSKHQQAIVARCRKILNAEKIEQVTDQQIAEVVQLHYPDIRQTLNELQLRFCMPKAA